MNPSTLRFAGLSLCLSGALVAQQLPEQQHMNWGTIFDPGGVLNNTEQTDSNLYLRIAAGTGPAIPHEEFIMSYYAQDASAWGFSSGGAPGDIVVEGIYLRLGDRDVTTSHEVGITIRAEDPATPGQPDVAAAPIAAFVLGSFSQAGGGFFRVEYDVAFPTPVTIPGGGSIFVGIELGRPAPVAPEVIEMELDELLLDQLLTAGAPAGANQDSGSLGTSRGIYGHGLGVDGGYGFVDDFTAGQLFFANTQYVATLTALQPSFSLAATTNQATLLVSNPGGTPGYTTSFASGHQPQTVGRGDGLNFVMRDRDPMLQFSVNPMAAYFCTFFLSLADTPALAVDLSTFGAPGPTIFPGSVGAICLGASGAAPLEVGTTFNGLDPNGFFTFAIANASLIGLSGIIQEAFVQGLILDLDPMSATPVRATGCHTVYFE